MRPDAEAPEEPWIDVTAAHLTSDQHTFIKMRSCPQALTACEWTPMDLKSVDSKLAAAVGLGSGDAIVAPPAAASGAGGLDGC